ncbi:hypothetical protein QEZ54_08725 [Catellatospora sp. KI3]|uniref:hypothetical protein n=1 Tax=Catellatospora sp. KI3 TaxID=3041620 RepID=UPI002482E870|nr:hypothetical protein [Catellatospora sp. KI3]MDI1461046.1 hypothetical protein [Catellatospora sp. KI3]
MRAAGSRTTLPPGEQLNTATAPRLLAAALTAVALVATCDRPSTTGPDPAPSSAPVPAPPQPAFTWKLTDDTEQHTRIPDGYTVTYLAGSITLRKDPPVLIGFRVDTARPGSDSQLLKTNVSNAAEHGWASTPASVDGGTGISFVARNGGQNATVKTVVAKGPVTLTVNVDIGTSDATAAKDLHDKLLAGLRFRTDGLSGTYPGAVDSPPLPFTLQIAPTLTGPFTPELSTYATELSFGVGKTTVSAFWQDPATAASGFAATRADLSKAAVKHQNDVKSLPALKDTLGGRVDEGFSFALTADDSMARYVGIVFRRGAATVRVYTDVGGISLEQFDDDVTAALAAPMGLARSWRWTAG